MAQFPCLPLWTDSWIADTAHLSREERGTYLDLLVLMWRTPGCRVPNDNDWIAKHLRVSVTIVETQIRSLINEFCRTDGNWITQKRLQHEFTKQFELGRAQSDRAKHPRKKKKTISPELAEKQIPAKPPTLPFKKEDQPSFFLNAAREQKADQQAPRSLATALPSGALTRSAQIEDEEPKRATEKKKPEDMTLAEINAVAFGAKR